MTTTKPQSTTEPELKPCRCGRKALIELFHDGDDPQPLFVATCEVCPVKTYDQFTAEEAARVWNEFVSATVNIPNGQWRHVQIKAGNPRVVAIQFETAEQATAFINSFAASPATPVVDESELRFALEGMIAAFDTDDYSSASIVATTRECALSVAKQAVGWPAAAAAAPVEQSDEYTEISCAGCGRDTDTKLLLCPTCVDSGHEGAR